MLFIVSTGRSGTKTIAQVLSLIHGCVCLHEPAPQLILESSGYRYGTVHESDLCKILFETRPPRLGTAAYCESNQTLSLIIPVLAKAFPDARYAWLIRNALDVVASAYQKQWYTGHSENHERYEDCPPIERAWIDGRIQGDLCGDVSAAEWSSMDSFERCCWYWSYVNRLIEADVNRYAPGRFILLRLEEIDMQLPSVIQWMGLRAAIVPAARRHNIAKRTPYHWTAWSDQQRRTFEYRCGRLMDRFYPSWRQDRAAWQDIEYRSCGGLLARYRKNYRFVKAVNRLLSRNAIV